MLVHAEANKYRQNLFSRYTSLSWIAIGIAIPAYNNLKEHIIFFTECGNMLHFEYAV